jgi:hypothetical protein
VSARLSAPALQSHTKFSASSRADLAVRSYGSDLDWTLSQQSASAGGTTATGTGPLRQQTKSKAKKPPECQNCFRLGHTYRKCEYGEKLPQAVYKSVPALPTLMLGAGDIVVVWDRASRNIVSLYCVCLELLRVWGACAVETTKSSKLEAEICEVAAVPMRVRRARMPSFGSRPH